MLVLYLVYALFLAGTFLWCKKIFTEAGMLEKIVLWLLYVFFAIAMYPMIAALLIKFGWLP